MFLQVSECMMKKMEPPKFVMSATSRLMRLYPVVLKATQLLDRLVR